MAALEEGGYIAQPHTSAGRVPTDKGYRVFVDQLSTVKPLSSPERRAIGTLLETAVDLDDVVDRAVRLIAQLTQQVAVVQYPSLRRSALRHVELVPVGPQHLLVVLITDTGRVEQRTLELGADLDESVVGALRGAAQRQRRRTAAVRAARGAGRAGARLRAGRRGARQRGGRRRRGDAGAGERGAGRARGHRQPRARRQLDVRTIGPVLEALEEQVVLLRLLSEMAEDLARWRYASAARHSTTASSRRAS